jgi:hypothetical protein
MAEIAREMLRGDVSFIEGSRRINRLRSSAGLLQLDADIVPFIGIDSETDALPIGDERQHWAPDALIRLQPAIDRAEKWAKTIGTTACERLIDRFGTRFNYRKPT